MYLGKCAKRIHFADIGFCSLRTRRVPETRHASWNAMPDGVKFLLGGPMNLYCLARAVACDDPLPKDRERFFWRKFGTVNFD